MLPFYTPPPPDPTWGLQQVVGGNKTPPTHPARCKTGEGSDMAPGTKITPAASNAPFASRTFEALYAGAEWVE